MIQLRLSVSRGSLRSFRSLHHLGWYWRMWSHAVRGRGRLCSWQMAWATRYASVLTRRQCLYENAVNSNHPNVGNSFEWTFFSSSWIESQSICCCAIIATGQLAEFPPIVKLSRTTWSYCFTFICFIANIFFPLILQRTWLFIRFWVAKWKRLIHIIARCCFQSHQWQWLREVFHSNAKTITIYQMQH